MNRERDSSSSSRQHDGVEFTWSELQPNMEELYREKNISSETCMKMRELVYKYCTNHEYIESHYKDPIANGTSLIKVCKLHRRELYVKVRDFLQSYTVNFLQNEVNLMDENFLKFYKIQWQEYELSSNYLKFIFGYLDCLYVKRENGMDDRENIFEIHELAKITWWKCLNEKVAGAVLKLIERERNGELIDILRIQGVISSYMTLSMNGDNSTCNVSYKETFKTLFLIDFERFYTKESIKFLKDHPVTEYLKKVDQRLQEEPKRIETYLDSSLKEELIETCERILITQHLKIFYAEFQNLLETDNCEDLSRMYSLVSRVENGLGELKTVLKKHITQHGTNAINKCDESASNNLKVYVRAIYDVHKKYNILIMNSFENNVDFIAAFDEACRNFINDNTPLHHTNSKLPELLARFCSELLHELSENPEQLKDTLDQVKIILEYIKANDVFRRYYGELLTKQLVQQMGFSENAAVSMISDLQEECSSEYVSKLQRMFEDISLTKDWNQKFRIYLAGLNEHLKIDFSIQLLSSGTWPFQRSINLLLPRELNSCVSRFTDFHSSRHSNRKLIWLFPVSHGGLITNCFKNGYTLHVSTYQMTVLLHFNQQDSWKVSELAAATKIELDYLIQVLQLLLKSKLLLVSRAEEEINLKAASSITLNTNYENEETRVNINTPVRMDVPREQESMRKVMIEAAIVRIMKQFKSMEHQQLLAEVLNELASKFRPRKTIIETCIENLIEKEYLKGVDGREKTYSYLA